MSYPAYRRQGLPITSSHRGSTINELNYRIKGTEEFWSTAGGEDVLQLRADSLCNSHPLIAFWEHRATTRSGFHSACRDENKQAARQKKQTPSRTLRTPASSAETRASELDS